MARNDGNSRATLREHLSRTPALGCACVACMLTTCPTKSVSCSECRQLDESDDLIVGLRGILLPGKGGVLLRVVGGGHSTTFLPPNASVQWQPDALTIHTNKWFLGAGFPTGPSTWGREPWSPQAEWAPEQPGGRRGPWLLPSVPRTVGGVLRVGGDPCGHLAWRHSCRHRLNGYLAQQGT